ncbi:electron transfer flavoprotein alpha subunit [Tamaricihabitans halophyticus]|uniref:Electron transfer flavoprotein alpha subunit n=1 Tax=Tamaricihabitans halophyticus TaxID=1262583 RepID=A0A4R2QY75_9PSEU|nr:mycofactocin-associated electron transfer flavoprotein alpha subunit [Tamaricihabitans halophyticus]TCP54129.1 electron transfer flavoprotein alpha subunit [Tamaricihabitans halophyticus]
MIAVIPVRDATAPLGANETVAEAAGHAVLIGSGTAQAADELSALRDCRLIEAGAFAPAGWATGLADLLRDQVVVLPAAPDGRDLAPRLADELDVPLLAGAIEVTEEGAALARWGSRVIDDLAVTGPFVATLLPGTRTASPAPDAPRLTELAWSPVDSADPTVVAVLPPDPRTADLAEAPRILGAGAGLTTGTAPAGAEAVAMLQAVGEMLGASVGATRVVTDAGFADYARQIGTTGVVIHPDLYIAFGISGAAQHIGGIAGTRHLVSVNTDPSCPMTTMADLGIVTDAAALLAELADRLGVKGTTDD